MEIQITKIELDNQQAGFFKFCCEEETEINKLREVDFFAYQKGRIIIDKANGKIRAIEASKKYKWDK